jgi:hypothetical protein
MRKGLVARYVGEAHPYLRGYRVRLLHPILDDDERPTDRWDAAPWLEAENRFSWVTSDVRPEELEPIDAEEDKP